MAEALPEDVIAEILSYIGDHRFFSSFPFLCKQWNEVFRRPKLAPLIFAARWDPERREYDYDSISKGIASSQGVKPSDIVKKGAELKKIRDQLVSIPAWTPGQQIWYRGTDSKKSLCWFTERNDKQIFLLTEGRIIALSPATGGQDHNFTPIELPKQFKEDFRMTLENHCAMWELERSTLVVDTRSNQLLKTAYSPFDSKYRSVNMKNMFQYDCRANHTFVSRGRYDSGFVSDGQTLVSGDALISLDEDVSTRKHWSAILPGKNKHLVGSNEKWVLILDVTNKDKAVLLFLDSTNGAQVTSCEVGPVSTVANVPFARAYFVSTNRCLILFQRFVTFFEIPESGEPVILSRVSNDEEMMTGAFAFRFNILFVEMHPEKWFLCREDSSLLVYQLRDGQLDLIRRVVGFPSVNSIAVDDKLNVYGTKFDSMGIFKLSLTSK